MPPIQPTDFTQVVIYQSTSAAIVAAVAEWTQVEKDVLFAEVEEIPLETWGHDDRRLSSRDVESGVPGEHLPSEEQIEEIRKLVGPRAHFSV